MQYGILHYDYQNFGSYAPKEVNLGDYIQSLAAKQFLPRVDKTIDRDNLILGGGC